MILSGKVHLMNIHVVPQKIKQKKYEYGTAIGYFCALDWDSYKKDPSAFPMFRHLVNHSCHSRNTFTYDLKKIVELAAERSDVKVIKPTAFVFHESRCGSTLVANALTAMDTKEHRVYSEAKPLVMATLACGFAGKDCPMHRATELVQDVVFVMGLTDKPKEKNMFFKVQSIGTKYMDVVLKAFPETPWIFVYRDPIQTVMSQMKKGAHHANCIHQLRDIPASKTKFLTSIDRKLNSLNPVEKCALHLSLLCDAAVEAIDGSHGMGFGVNYEDITNKLISTVFPDHFKLEMTEERRERIIDISGHYSKGIAHKAGKWAEDSDKKDEKATPLVKDACKTFLSASYNSLEMKEAKEIVS